MDTNQARIIELLREVHLITFKEVERLNLRIAELESRGNHQPEATIEKRTAAPQHPIMMNEHQVADFLNMSVASVRRWRLFRKGPKFIKIGRAVRYKREDVEMWL